MSFFLWEHSTRLPREQKMTTSELGIFLMMLLACVLWSIVTYTIGYKQGHYEGYNRGKSVGRHMSAKVVAD